jgi:thiol-disulfide isomerase/thioredoxin
MYLGEYLSPNLHANSPLNLARFALHAMRIKTNLFVIFALLLSAACANAQKAEAVTLQQFQKRLSEKDGKVLIVNFWATWCAPCIHELPFFEKLNKENRDVEVLLVSMDYDLDPDPTKVERFIDRKKLESKVLFLTADNPNAWIDKIEKRWSGALPATLVINPKTDKRQFVQGEVGEGQLEKLIEAVK